MTEQKSPKASEDVTLFREFSLEALLMGAVCVIEPSKNRE
jgi:hypothetical protein